MAIGRTDPSCVDGKHLECARGLNCFCRCHCGDCGTPLGFIGADDERQGGPFLCVTCGAKRVPGFKGNLDALNAARGAVIAQVAQALRGARPSGDHPTTVIQRVGWAYAVHAIKATLKHTCQSFDEARFLDAAGIGDQTVGIKRGRA